LNGQGNEYLGFKKIIGFRSKNSNKTHRLIKPNASKDLKTCLYFEILKESFKSASHKTYFSI
jgi:hypothetical protein